MMRGLRRSPIKNCGFRFPAGRITINLAPADRKKEGSIYDLPILLAVLKASEQFKYDLSDSIAVGEVALDGNIRPVNGILAIAITARQNGVKNLFVPFDNAREAAVIDGINVYGVASLKQLIRHFSGEEPIIKSEKTSAKALPLSSQLDFSDVKGQIAAKKALG